MHFELRPGVSVCDVGDRLIFLDLPADRYFCLGSEAEHAVRKAMRGAVLESGDVTRLESLIERRVLSRAADNHNILQCQGPVPATRSLVDHPLPNPGVFAVSAAAAATVTSIARLKLRTLTTNVAGAAACDRATSAPLATEQQRLTLLAAAFDRAGGLLSTHDRCLAQSLAVARTARRCALPVQIVFGVALGPFVAHCWVQSGPIVINDRLDTIRAYTPILVR